MPRLEYFVVSESSAVDRVSGRVSLFHILEHLRPQSLPAYIPKCVATLSLTIEDEEVGQDFQALFTVSIPGLEETQEFAVNFTARGSNHRIMQRSMGMPIMAKGCLRFGVTVPGTDVEAHHEITIHEADPGQPTDGTLVYSRKPPDDPPSEES